jgi:hypothetical protein
LNEGSGGFFWEDEKEKAPIASIASASKARIADVDLRRFEQPARFVFKVRIKLDELVKSHPDRHSRLRLRGGKLRRESRSA